MADVNLLHRILDIAYKNRLSHLGSYFSSVDIIDDVYGKMDKEDIFILSSGHCALALYTVVEKYRGIDAEYLFDTHGGHPHRCENDGLYCSTGSLGMGITAAVGRAIAKPDRVVHCLISDGECAEGSVWESLKFIYEHNIKNINKEINNNKTNDFVKLLLFFFLSVFLFKYILLLIIYSSISFIIFSYDNSI